MGEINLTAIEESDELQKRFDFLTDAEGRSRVGDRRSSRRRSRRSTAPRASASARPSTRSTPSSRRSSRACSAAGTRHLALTDESDLLETGIEIIAKPPGKKISQNIELLSGGEKALTAVSLLFAIFLIKPSPFCLLDEVDAPLDEANVGRFNEVVREMTDRSQFIVITHNKRTMEIADRLYGVTMEEPGVSKLVAVNLRGGPARIGNARRSRREAAAGSREPRSCLTTRRVDALDAVS